MAPLILEEAYEVAEAIEEGGGDAVAEELGDLSSEEAMHPAKPEDIAASLAISLSAAKMRLYRSLESFRAQYTGLMAA